MTEKEILIQLIKTNDMNHCDKVDCKTCPGSMDDDIISCAYIISEKVEDYVHHVLQNYCGHNTINSRPIYSYERYDIAIELLYHEDMDLLMRILL